MSWEGADTIGARIRQRRKVVNISLSELARRAQISKGYLSTLENDIDDCPSAAIVYRLSAVLRCSMEWLVSGQETEQQGLLSMEEM